MEASACRLVVGVGAGGEDRRLSRFWMWSEDKRLEERNRFRFWRVRTVLSVRFGD